jgi:hypothetical protein
MRAASKSRLPSVPSSGRVASVTRAKATVAAHAAATTARIAQVAIAVGMDALAEAARMWAKSAARREGEARRKRGHVLIVRR